MPAHRLVVQPAEKNGRRRHFKQGDTFPVIEGNRYGDTFRQWSPDQSGLKLRRTNCVDKGAASFSDLRMSLTRMTFVVPLSRTQAAGGGFRQPPERNASAARRPLPCVCLTDRNTSRIPMDECWRGRR